MGCIHDINWVLFKGLAEKSWNYSFSGPPLYLTPWTSEMKLEKSHERRLINEVDLDWSEIPTNVRMNYGDKMPAPSTGVVLSVSLSEQEVKRIYPRPSITRSELDLPILGLRPLITTTIPSDHCGLVDHVKRRWSPERFIPDSSKNFFKERSRYNVVSDIGYGVRDRVTQLKSYLKVFHVFPTNPEWRCLEAVELLSNAEMNHLESLGEFLRPQIDDILLNEDWDLVVTDSLAVGYCMRKVFPKNEVKTYYYGRSDLRVNLNGFKLGSKFLEKLHESGSLRGDLLASVSNEYSDNLDWSDNFLDTLKDSVKGLKVLILNLSNRYYTRKIHNFIVENGGVSVPAVLIKTSNKRM